MPLLPFVTIKDNKSERTTDIYSKLFEERIIFITGEIDDILANNVIAQLLWLEHKEPNKEIIIYINSPGGSVSSGMAILDAMNFVKCPISTICYGLSASMAAVLLSAGTPGLRYGMPNCEIMIHQPLGGIKGQTSDILIHATQIEKTRTKINTILAQNTGQTITKIKKDTERDNFMTSKEALKYGLIDKIINDRKEKHNEK